MRIAVVNAGTSSVKLAHADVSDGRARLRERVAFEPDDEAALRAALARFAAGGLDAVAHRVVHGGAELVRAVRIDAAVEAALERRVALAPLHNPPGLAGIRLAREVLLLRVRDRERPRERIAAGLRAGTSRSIPNAIAPERRPVYVFETEEEPLIAREAAAVLEEG